jgi:hypothetical protein
VRLCFQWAWAHVPSQRSHQQFRELIQGPSELITDFIAHLERAIQAKVSHAGAMEVLARSVIWEGLNKE